MNHWSRGRRACAPGSLGPVSSAERTKGRRAVDRTRYGSLRASTRSFYAYHLQQISKAAVMYDARAIRKEVITLKQKAFKAAHAAPAGSDPA